MSEQDRKRYLAIIAIRYLTKVPPEDIYYDGAQCDGWALADDIKAEWDISGDELLTVQ